ncbi:MAG: hypothetical protein K1X51_02950 [Rhodospirillaceae bacterium]|nr:hypothetical protein [Rhodospirillaceae bacterium]
MRRTVVALALLSPGSAVAQDSFADAFWDLSVRSGFDFSSGLYGAAKPTEILSLPLSIKAVKGPWTLRADASWLRISGPAILLDAGGAGGAAGIRTSGHASGIGDLHLFGTYSVESLWASGWFVDLTARVKAPTASFAKGLGTGAWDGGGQVDIAKTIGNLIPFMQVGYRFSGSPVGYVLRNVLYGSVGAQYTWNERVTAGVSYDIRQAALVSAKTPQEGTAYLNYKFSDRWSANVYGTAGFSPNSPSAGGGVAITFRGF